MTAKKKNVIGYVLASLAIIAADQALKAWVVRNIPLNASAAQQRALALQMRWALPVVEVKLHHGVNAFHVGVAAAFYLIHLYPP